MENRLSYQSQVYYISRNSWRLRYVLNMPSTLLISDFAGPEVVLKCHKYFRTNYLSDPYVERRAQRTVIPRIALRGIPQ